MQVATFNTVKQNAPTALPPLVSVPNGFASTLDAAISRSAPTSLRSHTGVTKAAAEIGTQSASTAAAPTGRSLDLKGGGGPFSKTSVKRDSRISAAASSVPETPADPNSTPRLDARALAIPTSQPVAQPSPGAESPLLAPTNAVPLASTDMSAATPASELSPSNRLATPPAGGAIANLVPLAEGDAASMDAAGIQRGGASKTGYPSTAAISAPNTGTTAATPNSGSGLGVLAAAVGAPVVGPDSATQTGAAGNGDAVSINGNAASPATWPPSSGSVIDSAKSTNNPSLPSQLSFSAASVRRGSSGPVPVSATIASNKVTTGVPTDVTSLGDIPDVSKENGTHSASAPEPDTLRIQSVSFTSNQAAAVDHGPATSQASTGAGTIVFPVAAASSDNAAPQSAIGPDAAHIPVAKGSVVPAGATRIRPSAGVTQARANSPSRSIAQLANSPSAASITTSARELANAVVSKVVSLASVVSSTPQPFQPATAKAAPFFAVQNASAPAPAQAEAPTAAPFTAAVTEAAHTAQTKSPAPPSDDASTSAEIPASQPAAKEAKAAPVSPAPAPASPPLAKTPDTVPLPQTHRMLDTTPSTPPSAPPLARIAADATGEQQMHVGLRTTAFGSVEIHTTVVQNQVGLSVHAERGLTHWFSSEVQNIASGLQDHHLNLSTVDLDSGTGIQTATSFHHDQQQRNGPGIPSLEPAPPLRITSDLNSDELEPVEAILPGLSAASGATRVSIRI